MNPNMWNAGMRRRFESSELKDMAIEKKGNLTKSEPRSGAELIVVMILII